MIESQEKVKKFIEDNKISITPEVAALDLSAEVGGLSKEILLLSQSMKTEAGLQIRRETISEFGDVFYSLIVLSNMLGIELDKALDFAMSNYQQSVSQAGGGTQ